MALYRRCVLIREKPSIGTIKYSAIVTRVVWDQTRIHTSITTATFTATSAPLTIGSHNPQAKVKAQRSNLY